MKKNVPWGSRILLLLSSVKITVICLLLLFILTFWGTVAQVSNGLYAAQERFFYSFFFLAAGFIPFPGAQLVMWVLFINLVASGITHFKNQNHWRDAGSKITHLGVLIYFAAAFVTFHVTQDSNLHLAEGEGSNVSSSYDEWELAAWKETGSPRHVTAFDANNLKPGDVISFPDGMVTVDQFYRNCAAFTKALPADGVKPVNDSGITLLQPKEAFKEHEKNTAGVMFRINNQRVLLFGGEKDPTKAGPYYFSLRHKHYLLPFTLRLDQFKAKFYPGTQMAKSYESYVSVIGPQAARQAHIYMNNPLRYKDYTLYQASYEADEFGRQYSTLAVVRNSGRILPYVACFVVFFGLVTHFLMMAFEQRFKK